MVKRLVHCVEFRSPDRAMISRDLTQAKARYVFSARYTEKQSPTGGNSIGERYDLCRKCVTGAVCQGRS